MSIDSRDEVTGKMPILRWYDYVLAIATMYGIALLPLLYLHGADLELLLVLSWIAFVALVGFSACILYRDRDKDIMFRMRRVAMAVAVIVVELGSLLVCLWLLETWLPFWAVFVLPVFQKTFSFVTLFLINRGIYRSNVSGKF
jgi:hypothetical protein